MTGTLKGKEIFPFEYQFKRYRSRNESENDLKTVKWNAHLNNEEKYVWQSTQHKNENGS